MKSGLRAEGEQACWRARLCSLLNASKQAGEPLHGGVDPAESGDTRLEKGFYNRTVCARCV